MKQIFAALTVLIGLSSVSQAGIMIEPYLGYETGNLVYNPNTPAIQLTDNLTAPSYGLRLGYKFLLPWVALDYAGAAGNVKSGNAFAPDTTYTRSSLGAVIGTDLPLVRFWAGYGFSNELAYKSTATTNATKFKGTYLKAGLGLKVIPLMSVNVEYKINSYTRYDNGVSESDISNTFSSTKNDMIMLSLSAPFNL